MMNGNGVTSSRFQHATGVKINDMLLEEKQTYEACIAAGLEFLGKEDEFVHLPAEQRISLAMQYANGLSMQVHGRLLHDALRSIGAQEQQVYGSNEYKYKQDAYAREMSNLLNAKQPPMAQVTDIKNLLKLAKINTNEDIDSGEDVQRKDNRSEPSF